MPSFVLATPVLEITDLCFFCRSPSSLKLNGSQLSSCISPYKFLEPRPKLTAVFEGSLSGPLVPHALFDSILASDDILTAFRNYNFSLQTVMRQGTLAIQKYFFVSGLKNIL